MNTKDLTKNRGLFTIILSMAIIVTSGGLSAVYAATGSNSTQNQTKLQMQGSINLQQNIMTNVKTTFSAA